MNAGAPLFPDLGLGLGLRSPHYEEILAGRSKVAWFEAISENYMDDGGRPRALLEKIRGLYPVALHGVSLSIASVDPLNVYYLKRLRSLTLELEPSIVSDHCCWTGLNGENLHDLMPVPYTEEAVRHIVERILRVQDFLGRRILIENLSSYISFKSSEMSEATFLAEISRRADCGLLLDVNNIYVNSVNHSFDPYAFLLEIPRNRVGQMHLAGHTRRLNKNGEVILIDTHDAPVCTEVWALFEKAAARFGRVSTMIERDDKIPALKEVEAEVETARKIMNQVHRTSEPTATEVLREGA